MSVLSRFKPFFVLFLFASVSLPAQISRIQIENLTLPNGQQLPGIRFISQDKNGLLWLYTGFPGARYTYNGKTVVRIPDSDTSKMDESDRTLPNGKSLVRIRRNASGVAWGQTYINGGLEISCSRQGGPFIPIDTIIPRWYYDEVGIRNGRYFVKISDHVYEYTPDGRYGDYAFSPVGPDPISSSCAADAEGTLWAVYNPNRLEEAYSLYYLRPDMDAFALFPGQEAITRGGKFGKVYFDGKDLWYRGDPFCLFRRNAATGEFEDLSAAVLAKADDFPFYNSNVNSFFRDRSGQVWIASRAGVVKLSLEEGIFQYFAIDRTVDAACPSGNCAIRGITEDERGNIYFSYENGIARLDPRTGALSRLPLDLSVKSILPHNLDYFHGKLYWNEYEIDPGTGAHRSFFREAGNDNMGRAFDRAQGRMWMAVHRPPGTFYAYDLHGQMLKQVALPSKIIHHPNDEIRGLHYSPRTGLLFIGTMGTGLLEVSPDGTVKEPPLCCNGLNGMYEDAGQQLWVGSSGQGLTKIDLRTRQLTQTPYEVSPATGVLKNVFHILPEGKEHLWLITDQGVFRMNKKSGRLSRFPMFPSLSNMGFFRLPAFVSSDGAFYVGSIDGGVYAFRPEKVVERSRSDEQFPVALTRYSRYDERSDSTYVQTGGGLAQLREIRLTHRDRSFSLEFFVPDFRNTSQNLYTYQLEGYDPGWSAATTFNQLQYENLPPGTYTLRIRGGLMDEYFPSSERTITVRVLQAWYKTGWALAAYLLALAGIVFLLYRFQLQRQLEKAEAERIKELDGLKTSFYTNITHEFRTPLTVMLGMVDQLRGNEQERQIIRRNGRNLLRLVNQLLDLSKLDAGNMKLDLAQGDIIVYLRYLCESFQSAAAEKQIDLQFESGPQELIMDFDEVKVQHILYNLLSNALKFTLPGGQVGISVTEEQQASIPNPEPALIIRVRDTGIGIPATELPNIFDRFYQVDGTITRKGEGTGIGLALTKELVELMGGRITVQSAIDKGTTFTVRLPIRKTATEKRRASETPDEATPKADFVPELEALPSPLRGPRHDLPQLLIVEDNADVAHYIRTCVSDRFLTLYAADGREGFRQAVEQIPDIVICDVMMPEMDGYELTRSLKSDERTSHIPVILLTARATQDDRLAGLHTGADAYLTKPFDQRELLLRLDKLLEVRRVMQEKFSRRPAPEAEKPRELSLDELFLQKIDQIIADHMEEEDLSIDHFCRAVHLSYTQVYRKIKALTGKTPTLLIRYRRLVRAKKLLETTTLSVSEVAYQVGFHDSNYFSRAFRQEFGVPPSAVR